MKKSIMLSENDILEKEFNVEYRGYDAQQVDLFLDLIKQEYKQFEEIIHNAEAEIELLKMKLNEKEIELQKLTDELQIVSQQKTDLEEKGLQNADIINRLSKLESQINK